MEYVKGVAFAKALGANTTLACITSLTTSARCIYDLIACVGTHSEAPDIMLLIKKSDLERKIRLLETVLSDIDMEAHYTNSLALCISDLNQCLDDIKRLLATVHTRSSHNKSLYLLKRARSYGFTDIYFDLELSIMNLADRSKSLFDVSSINHNLVRSSPPKYVPDIIYEGHLVLDLPDKPGTASQSQSVNANQGEAIKTINCRCRCRCNNEEISSTNEG